MKQCTKCGVFSENFGKHKYTSDKLESWCRPCKNKQTNAKRDSRMKTKLGHISRILSVRKNSASKQNISFDIDLEYAFSIATDICPILGIELAWCKRTGSATDNSPSLDKFNPALGYVPGNVHWISHKANTIKSNATAAEVEAVANWMRKITNESA